MDIPAQNWISIFDPCITFSVQCICALMFRVGVQRWTPHHLTLNTTITNMTMDKDTITNPDLLITFAIIGALAIHSTLHRSNKAIISGVFALFCLILSAVFAPVIGSLFFIFFCYRQIATVIVSRTCKKGTFAGLMDGTDAFWAIEDKSSLSIINVLAMTDFSFIVSAMNNNKEPLQTVRELIMDRLLCTPPPFPKLVCFRQQSWFGYFFWEKQSSININEHVRFMDLEEEENGTVAEETLKGYISSLANLPLPENNKSNWEILVGRYPISSTKNPLDSMESGGWTSEPNNGFQYPILFRIHHTLGDGVALVNLLMDTLTDPHTRTNTPVENNSVNSDCLSIPETQTEEVPSFCLDIPQANFSMKKSFTYNFHDYYSTNYQQTNPQKLSLINKIARDACRKFFKFVEESKLKNNTYQERNLHDINISVNDRPSSEFLELMQNSNVTRENHYSQYCIAEKEMRQNKNKTEYHLLNSINNLYKSLRNIAYYSSTLFLAPACIFNQITKKKDVNILHGPKLSGYKVVAWHSEQEGEQEYSLMTKIKRIRSKTGAHFSDIILTALSSSLELLFKQCNEVPSDITVIIPARISSPNIDSSTSFIKSKNRTTKVTKLFQDDTKKILDNKFGVGLLTLPVANDSLSKVGFFSKLRQVRKQTDLLRNSPDYIISYWILKIFATLFPVRLVRPIFASTHSTIAMSNMPGPGITVKLAGHTLHNLVFWVPNRETTGVGVTILSYAGRLQLGIIADRSLIPCQQDAQLILNNMVSAIQEMDKISSSP